MELERWLTIVGCLVVPIGWGALWAVIFSRRDRKQRPTSIDYMI